MRDSQQPLEEPYPSAWWDSELATKGYRIGLVSRSHDQPPLLLFTLYYYYCSQLSLERRGVTSWLIGQVLPSVESALLVIPAYAGIHRFLPLLLRGAQRCNILLILSLSKD